MNGVGDGWLKKGKWTMGALIYLVCYIDSLLPTCVGFIQRASLQNRYKTLRKNMEN